jgi:hypothetical protein
VWRSLAKTKALLREATPEVERAAGAVGAGQATSVGDGSAGAGGHGHPFGSEHAKAPLVDSMALAETPLEKLGHDQLKTRSRST